MTDEEESHEYASLYTGSSYFDYYFSDSSGNNCTQVASIAGAALY